MTPQEPPGEHRDFFMWEKPVAVVVELLEYLSELEMSGGSLPILLPHIVDELKWLSPVKCSAAIGIILLKNIEYQIINDLLMG